MLDPESKRGSDPLKYVLLRVVLILVVMLIICVAATSCAGRRYTVEVTPNAWTLHGRDKAPADNPAEDEEPTEDQGS